MNLKFDLFLLSVLGGNSILRSGPCYESGHADAFSHLVLPRVLPASSTAARAIGQDWDNGDFLSSLSGGQDQIDLANDKYRAFSQNRKAMNEWRDRQSTNSQQQTSTQLQATPGGPSSEGGAESNDGPSPEFLRKMGLSGDEDMSQLRQNTPPSQMQRMDPPPSFQGQPHYPQQQPNYPQQQPQQQQFYDQHGNPLPPMPMVYDQNGNPVPYYPPQQQQQTLNQPLPQQQNVGTEPPLPRPSRERQDSPRPVGFNPDAYTMANTADVYFAQLKRDSTVRKEAWLRGDKEKANQVFADDSVKQIKDSWVDNPYTKEKNMEEARKEIEGMARMQLQEDISNKASSGISYKERLQEMKAKRSQKSTSSTPNPNISMEKLPPPTKETVPPLDTTETPPAAVSASQSSVSFPSSTAQTSSPATNEALADSNEDQVRQKLRTLQGLLIKHRGGPGFGSGRLKGPEAQRLETVLGEVTGIISSEAGNEQQRGSSKVESQSLPVTTAEHKSTVTTTPAEQVTSVPPASTGVGASPDPMAGAVACVEATLKMYKDASPAEREALLIPLREAMMSAASASNRVMGTAEATVPEVATESTSSLPNAATAATESTQPNMGFPTTYAVTKPEKHPDSATSANPSLVSGDTNTEKLTSVYDALVKASGSGKFGLKNISGNEAEELIDQLTMMRGVLLDELNS